MFKLALKTLFVLLILFIVFSAGSYYQFQITSKRKIDATKVTNQICTKEVSLFNISLFNKNAAISVNKNFYDKFLDLFENKNKSYIELAKDFLLPIFSILTSLITLYFIWVKLTSEARFQLAGDICKFRMKQLEEFYAPVITYLSTSEILYNKLLYLIEESQVKNKSIILDLKSFRLHDHIFEFTHGDYINSEIESCINEILSIGMEISKLFTDKAGLIEGGVNQIHIKYTAHYKLLCSRKESNVHHSTQDYMTDPGYYPRMLNRHIWIDYKRIVNQLRMYSKASDKIVSDLFNNGYKDFSIIQQELLENLNYYEENADQFDRKYTNFEFGEFFSTFLTDVQNHTSTENRFVLDFGCGPGRDTVNLLEAFTNDFDTLKEYCASGIQVYAIDASPKMIRLCRNKYYDFLTSKFKDNYLQTFARAHCKEKLLEEINYNNKFVGIWASASILHVNHDNLSDVFNKIVKSLKPGGLCYVSLLNGNHYTQIDGRIIYRYTRNQIINVLKNIKMIDNVSITYSDKEGKKVSRFKSFVQRIFHSKEVLWINIYFKKKNHDCPS